MHCPENYVIFGEVVRHFFGEGDVPGEWMNGLDALNQTGAGGGVYAPREASIDRPAARKPRPWIRKDDRLCRGAQGRDEMPTPFSTAQAASWARVSRLLASGTKTV